MANNENYLKNIFINFSKNLLLLQQQQTKITMDFLNNINNNNLNLTNINNNNDNKINQNNNQNLINSQNNFDHFKELIQEQSESDLSNVNPYNNILTNKINTNHKIQQKKSVKKRTYNEMLEKSMSVETESFNNFNSNKKMKKKDEGENFIKQKINEPIHYYYTDPLNYQWCFTETRGSAKDYYYRCSTSKCQGFGMISKHKENAQFILTKSHSIPYYEHTYTINKYSEINFEIPEEDFIHAFTTSKIFRISAIKDFLNNTEFISLEATFSYLKGKGLKNELEQYKDEIINALASQKVINSTKGRIFENLNKMSINNETNICVSISYKIIQKNETKSYTLFYIITEKMRVDIMKSSIKQAFIDISFKCVPPGMSNYKILVLSGFDMEEKKAKLLALALIPNQKEATITKFLTIMKNTYLFNPLLITSDFGKSLVSSIRNVFPKIKWIPCLFHFAQCQVKHLKKLGLFSKKNNYIGIEILFNVEQLCFVDTKKLYKLYISIKNKFINNNTSKYFSYFEKYWNPKNKIIYWNYHYLYDAIELDKKFIFLTNNIIENTNKILNIHIKKKCPRYEIFEKAITDLILSYDKREPINRRDEITKLFLFLLNNEPNGKVLDKKELDKLKKIFFGVDKNILSTGLSELIGWDDMFDNEEDSENINIEKIARNDDILNIDYAFQDEEDCDEAVNGNNVSENSEENINDDNYLILNKLSEESNNNVIGNILLKYQPILKDLSLDE